MADDQSTLESLVAELAQMRATLAAQKDTIAQQHSRITALEGRPVAEDQHQPTDDAPVSALAELGEEQTHDFTTSRRGLLRGAAAATAAAAVATVAMGGVQQAHAAPLADGGNFILGQPNSATAPTILSVTGSPQIGMLVSSDAPTTLAATTYGDIAIQGEDTARFITTGIGVQGVSAYGVGLVGTSGSYLDIWASGTGRILQKIQVAAGAPTTGTYSTGESIRDANGDLWLCTAGDGTTVGTWVKVATLSPGLLGGATSYLAKPIRLFDSRPGQPAASNPGTPLQPNSSTKVQVAGVSYNSVTVPSPLAGGIGNVTVLNASGGAFVEIVPSGAGFTGASTTNIGGPGQIVANGFNVALAGGALDIYVAGVAVDVIIDLFAIVS